MLKFAANLSMLFCEYPLAERFALAAQAGFNAVEIQFPYSEPAQTLTHALKSADLHMVLHNLPAGDWAAGERGIACHPDRMAEFRDGVEQAIYYAQILGVPQLNCLAGIVPPNVSQAQAKATLINNLQYAAHALEKAALRLLIEPINHFDIPGFFLNHTQQAIDLIAETGSHNIRVQYDLYHMQRMEGELTQTLQRHMTQIGHIQLADTPGRHEPGSGEINFPFVLNAINAMGYEGWIGCEYIPASTTEAGLGWLNPYRK